MKRLILIGVVLVLTGSLLMSKYFNMIRRKKVDKESKDHKNLFVLSEIEKKQKEKKRGEIVPFSFNVGSVDNPSQTFSNSCVDLLSSASLYPVEPVYVNYGEYRYDGNSDVLIFNAHP